MRFFDILISLIILLISFPILIITALILYSTGENQIFYLQKRVGFNHKIFYIFKFSTMLKNSPNMNFGEITIKDDPRVLKVGKFLRKWKINEIPQLFNVLKGDMSLVGYRPQTPKVFDKYSDFLKKNLYFFKPGITSIATLMFIDEEKLLNKNNYDDVYNNHISPLKEKIELWYLDRNNLFNYFKVLILTFFLLIGFNKKIVFKFFPKLKYIINESEII